MKKAQAEKMLIFVLTIIIVGFILVMGVRFLKGLGGDVDTAKLLDFENKIKSDIKAGVKYEAYDEVEYSVPAKFEKICITDNGFPVANVQNAGLCTSGNTDFDPVVCKDWKSKATSPDNQGTSVYLLPKTEEPIDVDRKVTFAGANTGDPSPGYECLRIKGGKFTLGFEGLGREGVRITDVSRY